MKNKLRRSFNFLPKSWLNRFCKNANFLTMLKCHNNSLGRLLFCVDHHQISYQVLFCKKWYFYSLESLLFNLEHHEASYLSLFQKKADTEEISNFWLKSWVNSIFFNYVKVTRPSFLGGYHPTLKLSGFPTFTFIVSLTHRMDNI